MVQQTESPHNADYANHAIRKKLTKLHNFISLITEITEFKHFTLFCEGGDF